MDRLVVGAEHQAAEEQTERLQRIVERITYKPGWRFAVRMTDRRNRPISYVAGR